MNQIAKNSAAHRKNPKMNVYNFFEKKRKFKLKWPFRRRKTLKKRLCLVCKKVQKWVKSFTLIELMVTISIISLASMGTISLAFQVKKPKDSRRKSDLKKIKIALEDFYDDKGYYPTVLPDCDESLTGDGGSIYLKKIPCDPQTEEDYGYETDESLEPQWFKLYTFLDNEDDEDIARVGCIGGCGPGDTYNFGVSSDDVAIGDLSASEGAPYSGELPSPMPSVPPVSCDAYYGCVSGSCSYLGDTVPGCAPSFCESNCQNLCSLGGYECD